MENETRKKVNELYKQIEENMDTSSFVLNKIVMELQSQLENIQNNCNHHYVNNKCIYCDYENVGGDN